MKDKRTIKEWENEFGLAVLDTEGFDRTDPYLFERLFTKDEFEEGLIRSTVAFKPNYKFVDESKVQVGKGNTMDFVKESYRKYHRKK